MHSCSHTDTDTVIHQNSQTAKQPDMHPNTQTSSSQYSSSASLSSSSLPPPCSRVHGHRRQHHQTHRIINISIITTACSHHIYHGGKLGVRVKVGISPPPRSHHLYHRRCRHRHLHQHHHSTILCSSCFTIVFTVPPQCRLNKPNNIC